MLVVDDNRDAADALADLLAHFGHVVARAYDGAQALTIAQSYEFDVAVLDVDLPNMDGHELARRLRGQVGERRVLFVAVTGYATAREKARSRAAGFDAHLTKPLDQDRLIGLLASD